MNSVTVTQTFPGYYEVMGTMNGEQIVIAISANGDFSLNNSLIETGVFHVTVFGLGGNDDISADVSPDSDVSVVISGDSGNDILSLKGSGAIWCGTGDDSATAEDSDRVEVYGEDGGDYLVAKGACYDGVFNGGAGNDTIDGSQCSVPLILKGGLGNDVIYDTSNSDWIYGDDGNDTLVCQGGDFDDKHSIENEW
jgi:Ca2+-binding RTX toxin-like protein